MDHVRTRSLTGVLMLMIVVIWAWGAQAAAAPSVAGTDSARVVDARSVSSASMGFDSAFPRTFTLPVKALDNAPAPRTASPGALDSTTVTLLSDGFENGFAWQADYFSDASWVTTWGLSSYRACVGSYSAYCAQSNNPNAPYHYYPDGMDGYMVRGPFNLANSNSATLGFDMWIDSEQNYDWLSIYYSLNGTYFYEIDGWSGYSGGWMHEGYNVSSLCGQPQVWIAFGFSSDADTNGEGAYVDDVSLTEVIAAPPDSTPPTTTALGADARWHRNPVTVTFSAADNPGGSGLARTMYSLDGGPWTVGTQVQVSIEGINTVSYYSIDNAGNAEAAKACTVKIDMTPPTPSAYAASMRRNTTGSLRFRVADISRATVNVTVKVKNSRGRVLATRTYYGQPTNTMLRARYYTSGPKGTYWFYVSARDTAGNAGTRTAVGRLVVK